MVSRPLTKTDEAFPEGKNLKEIKNLPLNSTFDETMTWITEGLLPWS